MHKTPSGKYQYSDDPHSAHRKIIDLVGKGKKVMDVGCSRGYLAQKFRENGCFVLGIESDPQSAAFARQFCDDLIVGDVEALEGLKYPRGHFDAIVFADVLEHLKRPEDLLLKFRPYLKDDGVVIASLPNIARVDIRLKLLFGKFDYQDGGILDRTHLRFFTLKTAKEMFARCGLLVEKVVFTALASRLKVLPGLLAFQFILVCRLNQGGEKGGK